MAYRIALTGAQGTGKSTVAREVCAAFRAAGRADVQACAGLGDYLAEAGFKLGVQAGADTVRMFARAHIEREASTPGALQVYDRCLLDTLAYAQVLGCLPGDEFEALCEATVASSARFAQLVWLRVTHDYPVAGDRDESPGFRRAVDAAVGSLARKHRIALIEHALPPDTAAQLAGRIVLRASRG